MASRSPTTKSSDLYLRQVLTARVYDVAVESALEPARNLSQRLHNQVLLKREDQPVSYTHLTLPTKRIV